MPENSAKASNPQKGLIIEMNTVSVPNIADSVKPLAIPEQAKQNILAHVTGRVVGRVSDAVREVLENGGFLCKGLDDHGRHIFVYERVSRRGQPLQGTEAAGAPCYCLTVRGSLTFRCSCPRCRRSISDGDGPRCKHIDALDLWLSDTPWISDTPWTEAQS